MNPMHFVPSWQDVFGEVGQLDWVGRWWPKQRSSVASWQDVTWLAWRLS